MKKRVWKKILALSLSATMVIPFGGITAKAEESSVGKEYQKERSNREERNFNSDWKFYLGDVENGQAVDYDDSAWTDIAIPHNFSVPYDMESTFYVGYGWYRKEFQLPENLDGKRVALEFEGVFQVTEVYVNGQEVGIHKGGYTGFEYDITDFIVPGDNQVAIRVNNIWQPDLSPRAGDHQFTGGIYRDVYLNITDDVHVTWYGTFVTTPDLTNPGFDESAVNVSDSYTSEEEIRENIEKKQSNVNVQTEVKNDSDSAKTIWVKQQVADAEDVVVAEFSSPEQVIEPGKIYTFNDTSEQIKNIKLWDTENPYMYTVYTTVYADGTPVDTYESPLGFRWAQYRNDGFYLNGEYTLLDGANVHQDHGGWADAVTNSGFYRDVEMIKEVGMNFIRGSHYPHDPSFAEACDELGIMFWSESVFWGMGGSAGKDAPANLSAADWFKDAYPQNPEDEEAFEESCFQALTDMIRINRNHPSVINWSMGNEVFFTAAGTQQKAKNLVNKMRNLSHLLDPTRKAGMGGVQRENYDRLEICDIAGYNGDGGKITNTSMPNLVAEYGSKTADRPGEFRPFYDQIQKPGTTEEYQLTENSAGLSLWCAFHHGTIGGAGLAKMGMIDYYRLPLNTWYWYREKNRGVPAEHSIIGTATQMELTASENTMTNDGTEDVQIILTMKDEKGNWVNTVKKVTLEVVSGPGVFPSGKIYEFVPGKTMLDGKAAIEFRSYYPGETVIRATSPGMQPAELRLTTVDVRGETGEEPDKFYEMSEPEDTTDKIADPFLYGTSNVASGRPAFPSSNEKDRTLVVDGNPDTSWVAEKDGSGEYWMSDLEFAQYLYKIKLDFETEPYPYKIEVAMDKNSDDWTNVAEYTKETVRKRPYEESLNGVEARYVKITFTDVPENAYAFLSECEVYGVTSSQSPQYATEWKYLSDIESLSESTGWGQIGKDVSCEGNPISVGGITYEKGLGFHADSSIVYNLEGKYTRFQAYAGIDDEVGTNVGDAIFQVYADEKLIYEKNLFTGDSDFVDLSVSGVKKLKLVTTKNGTDSNDHTDWADAKVLGAIRETTVKNSGFISNFTSNTQEFHPGDTFKAVINLKNVDSEQNKYIAALTLYEEDGKLADLVFVNDYLSKGKETVISLKMEIPKTWEGGRLHVNVWDAQSLELISQTDILSAGDTAENPDSEPGEHLIWTKVDGEDMVKVGNWKVWNDNAAYQTTETYTGDKDTPLTADTSISYTFKGTKFKIGVKCDQGQRGADVYVDDVKVGTIHNQSVEAVNEYKVMFESEKLEDKDHTVKLVPIGKFGIDYLEYAEIDESEPEKPDMSVLPGEAMREFFAAIETEDMAQYTESSCLAVSEAMMDAAYKYVSGKAGSEEYTESLKILQEALDNLEKKPDTPTVDKTKLQKAIAEAEKLHEEDYTADTWKIFLESLKKAKEVEADKDSTQEAVNAAEKALADAQKALENAEEEPREDLFDDVRNGDWYYDVVKSVNDKGYMTGLTKMHFGAQDTLVRAQFAVILYRMAGEPKVNYKDKFADVKDGNFYSDAVTWASENGMIKGYDDTGLFGPNDAITREQMATIMYRYADFSGKELSESGKLDDFPDADKVQEFAEDAVKWCVEEKIIMGDKGRLNPQGSTFRAECAAIISRFAEWKDEK